MSSVNVSLGHRKGVATELLILLLAHGARGARVCGLVDASYDACHVNSGDFGMGGCERRVFTTKT